MIRHFAIASTTILMCAAHAFAQINIESPNPQVSGTGQTDVLVRAASAVILVSLTGQGTDGPEAARALDALVAKVNDALKTRVEKVVPYGGAYGENQQIRRMMAGEPNTRTSKDYIARHGVAVQVSPNNVQQVINSLIAAGIDGVSAVVYVPDETDPAFQQAMTRATAAAKANAQKIAEGAGGQLGALIRIGPSGSFGFSAQLLSRFTQSGMMSQTGVILQPSEVLSHIVIQGTWRYIGN